MMESTPRDNAGDRISNRTQDHVTLGNIIDEFISNCPSTLYREALVRPVVRRYLVTYVLQRVQWELPPELLRLDESQPSAAAQDAVAFREYVECAIYWGMEEIINNQLDLSLIDSNYPD